jgi:uncharacterized protein (DUF924 family)
MTPEDVVAFWTEAGRKRWFAKSPTFDGEIRERFEIWHHAAARRELDGWSERAEGALALLLLLDQFPRNLWRGSAHAFATDPLARHVARKAVAAGFDRQLDASLTQFFYLPLEHSEVIEDQDQSCALAEASGDQDLVKWANIHRDIIRRFGRFPHRNMALGRETTEDEAEFMRSGGFAG